VSGISGLLFGIDPRDPTAFVATALLLAAVTAVASYVPTRRATAVSPLIAMRQE